MTTGAVIGFVTEKQVGRLFAAGRLVPADKLEWAPGPGTRSALDQLQEAATIIVGTVAGIRARKLEMSRRDFANWMVARAKLRDLDELEGVARAGVGQLETLLGELGEAEWSEPVTMPWPGEFTVADLAMYNYWNMSYHEGQIMTILQLLGVEGPGF